MTDYTELVKALRCNSLSKECDPCNYGYRLCPDSECNDACHVEQIYADAAAAIEALQAEVKRLKMHCADCEYGNSPWPEEPVHTKQPHWVSVEERLPEPHEYALCCGKKGGCFVGWTLDNADVIKANGHGRAFVHGGNARTFTHWMHLPEPPQEVQE